MKEEMSDFLRNLYASGAISNLHEAFEEYPVEEEWHKGKLENMSILKVKKATIISL